MTTRVCADALDGAVVNLLLDRAYQGEDLAQSRAIRPKSNISQSQPDPGIT
jgi:hypothetical protein